MQDIGSADVNDYLREVTGRDFTAKDFPHVDRHGAGGEGPSGDEGVHVDRTGQAQRACQPSRLSLKMLGNTRSVCRKSYIHPAIIDAYMDRTLAQTLSARAGARLALSSKSLSRTETAVLALLQRRLRREAQRKSA